MRIHYPKQAFGLVLLNKTKQNMTKIKEEFTLDLCNLRVKVMNEGIKSFEDQSPQALEDLKTILSEKISQGYSSGWIPYANFASSINWECIGELPSTNE